MKRLIGLAAALILSGVAILDVSKESEEVLGLAPVVVLLAFGMVMWLLLDKLNRPANRTESALPINLALWSHSLFEGLLAAFSFSLGFGQGLIVTGALILHLLPEYLAVITALKQRGYSLAYGLKTYAVTLGCLLVGFCLPSVNQTFVAILSTIVAGGFIYIAARIFKNSFELS